MATFNERQILLRIARGSLESALLGKDLQPYENTPLLKEKRGAFVTLKIGKNLRGCIGHIIPQDPLEETIYALARSSAFSDPRFPPLEEEELEKVSIEISLLSPITLCPDPVLIEVGKHGLLIELGFHRGLLLPQVPIEQGWDREKYLQGLCRKAGLPMDAWKNPEAKIEWFTAEVFGEE